MVLCCPLGHENPDTASFCGVCGESLKETAGQREATPDPVRGQEADQPVPAGQEESTGLEPVQGHPDLEASPAPAALEAGGQEEEVAQLAAEGAPATPLDGSEGNGGGKGVPAPVAATPSARLVFVADSREADLGGRTETTLGRVDEASNSYPDVDLGPHGGEEGGVSRLHARITLVDGQYLLEDLHSTNCTYVNHARVPAQTPTPLRDGDEIELGRVRLRFRLF